METNTNAINRFFVWNAVWFNDAQLNKRKHSNVLINSLVRHVIMA